MPCRNTSCIPKNYTGHEVINQDFDSRHLIKEQTIGNMVHTELQKIWGWFTGIGNIASGV